MPKVPQSHPKRNFTIAMYITREEKAFLEEEARKLSIPVSRYFRGKVFGNELVLSDKKASK